MRELIDRLMHPMQKTQFYQMGSTAHSEALVCASASTGH